MTTTMEPSVSMQDMNHAIATLAVAKHWTVKTVNNSTRGRVHACTIWHLGRRVTCQGRTPLMAITAAWLRVHQKVSPAR